jgi:hypothetical protein
MEAYGFKSVLRLLAINFPEVPRWLEEQGKHGGESLLPGTDQILGGWLELLNDTEEADCLQVIRDMACGNLPAPKWPSEFAREIHKAAKAKAAERKAAKFRISEARKGESYEPWCEICGDTGSVMVLHPDCVPPLQQGKITRTRDLVFVGVRCSCTKGEAFPAWDRTNGKGFPRFNSSLMIPVKGCVLERELPELQERALRLRDGVTTEIGGF